MNPAWWLLRMTLLSFIQEEMPGVAEKQRTSLASAKPGFQTLLSPLTLWRAPLPQPAPLYG